MERNRLRAPNADAVDAAGALTDMGKYLYREDRLPTYDLAVVITKLDMCRRRYEGGRCNRGTAGFAYVGGACVVNKRLEKVNSVAIIEDSGGFSGIIVAAHEVGHLYVFPHSILITISMLNDLNTLGWVVCMMDHLLQAT